MPKDTPKSKVPKRPPKLEPVPLRPDQTLRAIGRDEEVLIGRVIWQWTRLENCLNELILRFIGVSFEDGRLFIERMDPARSIALLRILGPRKLDTEKTSNAIRSARDCRSTERRPKLHRTRGMGDSGA
jgi:hypothetical protein